jgi:hypothetical protein
MTKTLFAMLTLTFCAQPAHAAEYHVFTLNNNTVGQFREIEISEHQTAHIVNVATARTAFDGTSSQSWTYFHYHVYYAQSVRPFKYYKGDMIVGPARINIHCFRNKDSNNSVAETGEVAIKVTDANLHTGSDGQPLNIVTLPADNGGDVELLVERSDDLLNWTPVYSGSAGTSNSAAFFRTRLINN